MSTRRSTPTPIVLPDPQDVIGLVQGQMPASKEEWFVAQALDHYGATYQYQYVIAGGTAVRGGLIIDFVVDTATGRVPVFVQGQYWHNYRNDPERILSLSTASHYFGNEAVELWEDKVNTREKARQAVRDNDLV